MLKSAPLSCLFYQKNMVACKYVSHNTFMSSPTNHKYILFIFFYIVSLFKRLIVKISLCVDTHRVFRLLKNFFMSQKSIVGYTFIVLLDLIKFKYKIDIHVMNTIFHSHKNIIKFKDHFCLVHLQTTHIVFFILLGQRGGFLFFSI